MYALNCIKQNNSIHVKDANGNLLCGAEIQEDSEIIVLATRNLPTKENGMCSICDLKWDKHIINAVPLLFKDIWEGLRSLNNFTSNEEIDELKELFNPKTKSPLINITFFESGKYVDSRYKFDTFKEMEEEIKTKLLQSGFLFNYS